MAKQKQEWAGWILLVGVIAFIIWLLTGGKTVLHEQVTTKILPAQEGTGILQFDSTQPDTVPTANYSGIMAALMPLGGVIVPGVPGKEPYCPSSFTGYDLWYDIATGDYYCMEKPWTVDLAAYWANQ